MADETYDVVIAGGGCKALLIAMYLAKYGGMSVGIFEKRHEIGGGLAGEEMAAPGHLGNTHANIIVLWYYMPHYRDFPEFEGYGAIVDQYLCGGGASFADNNTCLTIYSVKHDPTQERTAKQIARFSESDAEMFLKMWSMRDAINRVTMVSTFNPPAYQATPEYLQEMMAMVPRLKEIGIEPEPITMAFSPIRSVREMWESKELQYASLRFVESAAVDVTQPGQGGMGAFLGVSLPTLGFNRGGTHNIAHAAHKVLLANGVKIWTHSEVDKFIIENGTATGIHLKDGTEVKARKLVVSAGLSPFQLVDFIGRERLNSKLLKRVDLIEDTFGTIAWYTWAIHEAPKYKAAEFNPDVNEVFWLGLVEDADVEHLARHAHWKRLGKMGPIEDQGPVFWCHSLVDPSQAPEGRHTAMHEEYAPHATALTEREWLEFKKSHAEEVQTIWQKHAPNMTWDNIIGYDGNTPWDNLRMPNYAPNGCMAGPGDRVPYQTGQFRPTPELANYRTPIKNLYATGGAWHSGTHAGSSEAYCCYKIIAEDLGLGKPWLEPGKEEPDSLLQELEKVEKRLWKEAEANPK